MLPPDQFEAFERFVDEVERVSAIGERPLCLGREQGVGESGRRKTGADPREQGALGRFAMAQRLSQRFRIAGSGRLPSGARSRRGA